MVQRSTPASFLGLESQAVNQVDNRVFYLVALFGFLGFLAVVLVLGLRGEKRD